MLPHIIVKASLLMDMGKDYRRDRYFKHRCFTHESPSSRSIQNFFRRRGREIDWLSPFWNRCQRSYREL